MYEKKSRWGKKEICPCPRAKKNFTPRLDDSGNKTGGGKCWSASCGQKHFPDPRPIQGSDSTQHVSPRTRRHVYKSADGTPTLMIAVATNPEGDKRAYAEHWKGAEWVKGAGDATRIPYRLPEVIPSRSLMSSQLLGSGITIVCVRII